MTQLHCRPRAPRVTRVQPHIHRAGTYQKSNSFIEKMAFSFVTTPADIGKIIRDHNRWNLTNA
jgi:hypothetical protein